MKYQVKKNLAGAFSVKFDCPGCQVTLSDALIKAGQSDSCPECSTQFEIPGKKELAQYQAKLQQQENEKAARIAEREAEKENTKPEKERKQAEAIEVVEREKERLESERKKLESKRKKTEADVAENYGIRRHNLSGSKYKYLRQYIDFTRAIAYCWVGVNAFAILAYLRAFSNLDATDAWPFVVALAVVWAAFTVFVMVCVFASADFLQAIIDIEENTRKKRSTNEDE